MTETLGRGRHPEILELLPHRYPFLMIDRIIAMKSDESAIGIKNVTFNEPQFQGHFPGQPVFPGVLMIEGMAQTAGALCVCAGVTGKAEERLLPHHRQGQVPQAGRAGRRRRVSHDQEGAAQEHVVVSRRGEGRRRTRRRSRSRRHADRGMSRARDRPFGEVAPGAVIGADVTIGPYCVIGPNVAIGDGCELIAHVHVAGHTTIGAGTAIYPFASLGTPPQSVHYRGGPTALVIGAKCQIRENVTINTGTEDGGGITTVGDNCFLMVGAHVGA